MSDTYDYPEFIDYSTLILPITRAEDALARLDERLRRSPLADGLNARLAYHEACACRHAEGDLVHLEDLVLFDAMAFDGPISPALSIAFHTLKIWRRAQQEPAISLLHGHPPAGRAPNDEPDPAHVAPATDPHRLTSWRTTLNRSDALPPVLAAAIVWDAWLTLEPEPSGAWRAPLLAALVLKARRKTENFLLPIDTGRRFAKYRRHPAHGLPDRLTGFLEWIETASIRAAKELDSLVLAERLLQPTLASRRRHSRLPALAALLLSRPLISAPVAAKHLRVSQQAVLRMMLKLGNVPRELSGRARYRVWAIL